MALINVRVLLKFGQLITDAIHVNTRAISLGHVRCLNNTITDQKKTPESKVESNPVEDPTDIKMKEEFEKLNKDIGILTEKNTELIDKYKRALADGENLRTRLSKQVSDARLFGIQSFCKDLLEVADVLNKATESVPKEAINDDNPHLKSLYEGLIMTEAHLKSVFKRHGLEPVDPLNEKFNPNFHEALFQQEVKGKTAGTVVVVSKIGYKLRDRVIRPALVGVSK